MIINVIREAGEFLWKVHPTEDDGSPIVRNGNDVPFRPNSCAHGVVWDRVGELIAGYSNGAPVSVVYHDDNGLTSRVARSRAKRFTVDLPHRVYHWIGWRNVGSALLAQAYEGRVVNLDERGEQVHRLAFPAVPGVRAALDRLVELVDGVRVARRDNPPDAAACQDAIERLDAVYRALGTPWCDVCKDDAVWRDQPGRWAHVTEAPGAGGHEVTVKEWDQT